MRRVIFEELGLVDYAEAWAYQEKLFNGIVATKMENRQEGDMLRHKLTPNYLLFCQHPHVYTLGKSGHDEYLLLDDKALQEKGATYYKINRGGDITYHGPGQIVGYPIFDLDHFFTDIHRYLRTLEEAVILTLQEYGISSGRISEYTGVWIEPENPLKARKICAMGVKCSRWVTMHGFAFNVNPDLSYFDNIIPCGIRDKAVTSMERELGRKVDIIEVQERLKLNLSNVFDFDLAGA
jgi:lipoyl(octanoyl) transferase